MSCHWSCTNNVCFHVPAVAEVGPDVVHVNEGYGQTHQARPLKESHNEGDSHMICIDKVAAGKYARLIDAPKGQFFGEPS